MPWNKESETPPGRRGKGWPRIVWVLARLGGTLAIIAAVLDMVMRWRVYAAYPDCPLVEMRRGLWTAALGGPLWWALGGLLVIVLSVRRAGK